MSLPGRANSFVASGAAKGLTTSMMKLVSTKTCFNAPTRQDARGSQKCSGDAGEKTLVVLDPEGIEPPREVMPAPACAYGQQTELGLVGRAADDEAETEQMGVAELDVSADGRLLVWKDVVQTGSVGSCRPG